MTLVKRSSGDGGMSVVSFGPTRTCKTLAKLAGVRSVVALGIVLGPMISTSRAQAPPLGTLVEYGVLGATTVTNTGATVIFGSVGVSPGAAVIGFPPGIVVAPGTIHAADAAALQAQNDLSAAYISLLNRPATFDLTGQNLGGLTLVPGVYSINSPAQLTGVLTLNALGNSNAVFIFNIASSLTTSRRVECRADQWRSGRQCILAGR